MCNDTSAMAIIMLNDIVQPPVKDRPNDKTRQSCVIELQATEIELLLTPPAILNN